MLNTALPEIDGFGQNGSFRADYNQSKVSASAFAYDIGVALRYQPIDKLMLFFKIDYLGSNPKYAGVKKTVPLVAGEQTVTISQNFAAINVGIGAAYGLF